MDNNSPNGMNQRHTCITQQSNGVGVRFLHVDDGLGSFIRGITPDFNNVGTPEVIFHLYWYQLPIECLGQNNNQQTDNKQLQLMFISYLGVGVDRTNIMGTFFVL